MLNEGDIERYFETYDVYEFDPEAREQRLSLVIFHIAKRRGSYFHREPEPEDAEFAALAICLPMFRQRSSYTDFMRQRRREWFPSGLETQELKRRAIRFFDESLYGLMATDLELLVNGPEPEHAIEQYLGALPEAGAPEVGC